MVNRLELTQYNKPIDEQKEGEAGKQFSLTNFLKQVSVIVKTKLTVCIAEVI
jgi:hypothetical protein